MTSYIIAGKDKDKRKEYALALCLEENIDTFDITTFDPEKRLTEDADSPQSKSIGISDIKAVSKKLFLKPFRSPKKAIIFYNAEMLTIEAQNALLKVLEEPPDNTLIILSSERSDVFLPTILSRCTIIELTDETPDLSQDEVSQFDAVIENLFEQSIGDSLKLAETLAKNKLQALVWLEKAIIAARLKLHLSESDQDIFLYAALIRVLQNSYTIIKTTNANPRLVLENSFLSLISDQNVPTPQG